MNRRTLLTGFAATAAGLLVPEPRRVYSFIWGREMPRIQPYRYAVVQLNYGQDYRAFWPTEPGRVPVGVVVGFA